MVKIRLKRYGKKREVSYRIVAINSRARRDGRPIEELGFYNPERMKLDLTSQPLLSVSNKVPKLPIQYAAS